MREGYKPTELRKKIQETPTEILNTELKNENFTPPEIKSADLIKFQENEKFSAVLYDLLAEAIKDDQDVGALEQLAQQASEQLNPVQAKILNNIVKKIKKGLPRHQYISGFKNPPPPLWQQYQENPELKNYYLKRICENLGIDQSIDWQRTSITKLGTGIITIKKEAWKDFDERYHHNEPESFGFFVHYTSDPYIKENDYQYSPVDKENIIEQTKRMVFVNGELDNKKISAIIRHEIFHELFQNFTQEEGMDSLEIFTNFKNELVGYLLGEEWPYFISSTFKTDDVQEIYDNLSWQILEKKFGSKINTASLRFNLRHGEIQNISMIEAIKDKELLTPEEITKLKTEINKEPLRIKLCLRQLERLKYLQSNKFTEAIKKILASQSFTEVAYQLSTIDQEKQLDASLYYISPIDNDDQAMRAQNITADCISQKIPVKNLDLAVNDLKNYYNQAILFPISRERELLINDIKATLDSFDKNPERWLKLD